MLNDQEFALLKSHQYCDNADCPCYNQAQANNIRTHSRSKGQVYCNICKNMWVLTKGTMFFNLRTPIDKVVNTLLCVARGMGVNNTCEQCDVSADTLLDWQQRAAEHVNEFSLYMQQEMNLEQAQIDEFWSFIRKKKAI